MTALLWTLLCGAALALVGVLYLVFRLNRSRPELVDRIEEVIRDFKKDKP